MQCLRADLVVPTRRTPRLKPTTGSCMWAPGRRTDTDAGRTGTGWHGNFGMLWRGEGRCPGRWDGDRRDRRIHHHHAGAGGERGGDDRVRDPCDCRHGSGGHRLAARAEGRVRTAGIGRRPAGASNDRVRRCEFASEFGARTQGAFDPKSNVISLPKSVADNPEKLRLVLLHEGIHWLQDNVAGGAEALGGPIGDALRSAGAVRSTAGGKADVQHDEAQAYLLEALVANELGIRDTGLGVDSSGRALTYDAIMQKIRRTAEYT